MKSPLALIAATLILAACATSRRELTEDGEKVEVYANRPGSECAVVGKVTGMNDQGSRDLARNHARNLAGKMGANGIFINQEVPNGAKIQVFATAYKCE